MCNAKTETIFKRFALYLIKYMEFIFQKLKKIWMEKTDACHIVPAHKIWNFMAIANWWVMTVNEERS